MDIQLTSPRLLLRPLCAADAQAIQVLASDHRIAQTTGNIPHPYPSDAAAKWIEQQPADRERGIFNFGVCLGKDASLIGTIAAARESPHSRATIGYWIGVPYWGHGYATEAVGVAVQFAFSELKVQKLAASVLAGNPASSRVLEKASFQLEGRLRRHFFKSGVHQDLLVYGRLHDDVYTTAASCGSETRCPTACGGVDGR